VEALVVDDIPESREVLAEMLGRIGVVVRMAGDGQEALEAVRAKLPDIVFMDLHMPGMDGAEAMRRIWEGHDRKRVKIAAVSASVLMHEQEQVVAAGFDAFLGKPIRAGHLYACLAGLLGVEYEYAGPAPAEADLPVPEGRIELPEALTERLRQAAALYHVTELRRCLREVEALDPPAQRLAARLRERVEAYDMEGVLRLLEDNGG
jgi:CheY-like chemotaxis protein